jgi:ATP-dependent RNA helicase MSS116
MGGGPRTFPGGLNKWQWKRLHEKKAREKEKRLLDQEKQLYQARIRSQIRSKIAYPQMDPTQQNYAPVTPGDHVKSLADRFMKEGADDLWNEADGPLSTSAPQPQTITAHSFGDPVDVNELISDRRRQDSNNFSNFSKPRFYSTTTRSTRSWSRFKFRNADTSSSEDDSESVLVSRSTRNPRFPRLGSGNGDDESEEKDDENGGRGSAKKMMSSAALGNYDKKIKKRIHKKILEDEEELSDYVAVIRSEFNKRISAAAEENAEAHNEESILSEKRFDECNVSPLTVKALTDAGYLQMTKVQEATLSACLEGKDVLVKARTGTGKSAAFLLPAIETVLNDVPNKRTLRVRPVFVLILCPTRELASQLAAEANVLLKYHEGIGVQTLVGGTRFKVDQQRLESQPCQIIVATPGRLLDHIENKSGFSVSLMGLKMLILDEANRLLDLGFRRDIEKIVDCLPRKRQTLLFSATLPKEVSRISQLVLKREHAYIDTVGFGCLETHAKVKQSYVVAPHEQHLQIVHHMLKEHMSQDDSYKVIVFCTTGMMTSLMFTLLNEMKMNVRQIHSRLPQLYRTRVSDEFKEVNRIILVSSDVTSRGMNYPDVTLVIQVGIPTDRGQYIHRLGRTGREGKDGEGILLIAPWEQHFLDEIKDLPVERCDPPNIESSTKFKIKDVISKIDTNVREAAYHSWLGYYNSNTEIGRDKTTLVDRANQFSESIGLKTPPSIFRKTAVKMGLRDIPGIRIRK